jgi:hypothetical protein
VTDARGADDAALAAYAASYGLDGEDAEADWRFLPERDREHWRVLAAGRGVPGDSVADHPGGGR